MTSICVTSYPVARYRFESKVLADITLPSYAGSVLRGIFGASLRNISCMVRKPTCESCALLTTCPYSIIFGSPAPPPEWGRKKISAVPNPYIIEPPAMDKRFFRAGETFEFRMVLIGRAQAQLALIILAWQRALALRVGRGEGRAELQRVVMEQASGDEQEVFSVEEGILVEHDTNTKLPEGDDRPVRLHFITPARIQKRGKPLGKNELTARDYLISLARRIDQLAVCHADLDLGIDFSMLAQAAQEVSVEGSLFWRDWTRWSSRQKQEMKLGGLLGKWRLAGPMKLFLPLLYLGQWTHVGKNATFGLGGYIIEREEIR